jgi:hypothetical protein
MITFNKQNPVNKTIFKNLILYKETQKQLISLMLLNWLKEKYLTQNFALLLKIKMMKLKNSVKPMENKLKVTFKYNTPLLPSSFLIITFATMYSMDKPSLDSFKISKMKTLPIMA